MRFIVGNDIRVLNPTKEINEWVRDNLVIDNPEYIKKKALGKWTGKTPRKMILYEAGRTALKLPFGVFSKVYKRFGAESEFEADFSPLREVLYSSNIELYPYQKRASEAAKKARNGIIVMPCGSGKTQTALQLVSEIGGRCLWLTHTQDLLNQSMNRAKSCFGLPLSDYGTITDGKVNVGKITFATVQTMCKIDLPRYKNEFDVIIVDECHKCIGSPTKVMQFYKVLTNLSARYKYGLTATPKRADGLEKSMFALLGDKIIEISKEEVKHTTCPVEVRTFQTGYVPNYGVVLNGDGTINYGSLVEDLIENEDRFNLVLNIINLQYKAGPMLVLANRVEYLKRLNDKFEGKSVCLSALAPTKASRDLRKESLRMLNSGELDCIFATYQLAKEGLDVPNLRYVVFATPEKDETTVTQSAGRVSRKSDGKQVGVVIDFEDDFGMYKGWRKKRLAIYKKLNFSIEEAVF